MLGKMMQTDYEQDRALELMLGDRNVLLTGRAGTGKSTVIRRFREMSPKKIAVLAPTGIAALNINGSTIHRFFQITGRSLLYPVVPSVSLEVREIVKMIDLLLIDEASMVRGDIFSTIDGLLRSIANPTQPFGGKQVIVVGDFYQLSPICLPGELKSLQENFGGKFAFQTQAWKNANFCNAILTNVHRQTGDDDFLEILNGIRDGGDDSKGAVLTDCIARFNRQVKVASPSHDTTSLCTTNWSASIINKDQDSRLPGLPHSFDAQIWGDFDMVECPAEKQLFVKIGSRVMLLHNKTDASGMLEYVNGDTGFVVHIDEWMQMVKVVLDNGKCITVQPHDWQKYEYELITDPATGQMDVEQRVVGACVQMPLKLAYAITIHKSQGLTLDKVHVGLGRGTFASGQLYTALSRCRSLKALTIDREVRLEDIKIDPEIGEFYKAMEKAESSPSLPPWDEFNFAVS
jgi:ATP-dependent exoDNAse (exonuclease V) alpha subunit